LELLQVAHGAERRATLGVERFGVGIAAKQPLVFDERRLYLGVFRQYRGAVRDSQSLRRLFLRDKKVTDAVFGHDARGLLRQRAPQIVAAARMFPGHRSSLGL